MKNGFSLYISQITILNYFMLIMLFINARDLAEKSANRGKIELFICISEKKRIRIYGIFRMGRIIKMQSLS